MEAVWFKSGLHGGCLTGELPVVVCLGLCRRDIADRFEQAVMIEPGHPFQRGQLDRFDGFPRCSAVNELGLVEAIVAQEAFSRTGQDVSIHSGSEENAASDPVARTRRLSILFA